MYIRKIHMKKYKRFYDLEINLEDTPKRIVALVGPNGCGKSSVFDSMIYLSSAFHGSFGRGNTKDYKYYSLYKDPGYNYQNIDIEFDQGSFCEVYGRLQSLGKSKTIFSFRSSFRYNNYLRVGETKAVSDILLNNYGASDSSDIDQRIEEDYRRLLAEYCHYRDENDLKPSEAKDFIIGELNSALNNCLDLEITSLGNIESNEGTLYFKKSDSDLIFDYNVLSAGEKEVLDILLDLYLRKNKYTDSIYIIDEPELHLNTAIQRSLLNEINKMVPDNCQIWIATHSIGFLRALQEELKEVSQIIEFKPENKWASESYILTPAKASRTMWQNVFSTALDDLTKLVCPNTIIYCEGRAEPRPDGSERGLDARVFNSIFSEKYPDVLFVSSGGNTELDINSDIALAILSKAISGLKILVLKDRDMASGKNTDEKARQIYLKNSHDSHRVLRRYEIENYLYDKEVLSAYCNKYDLKFDEGCYDSKITDIINQNVKEMTGIVKNCCNIVSNINPEVFKINLAESVTDTMEVYKELEKVIFHRE